MCIVMHRPAPGCSPPGWAEWTWSMVAGSCRHKCRAQMPQQWQECAAHAGPWRRQQGLQAGPARCSHSSGPFHGTPSISCLMSRNPGPPQATGSPHLRSNRPGPRRTTRCTDLPPGHSERPATSHHLHSTPQMTWWQKKLLQVNENHRIRTAKLNQKINYTEIHKSQDGMW